MAREVAGFDAVRPLIYADTSEQVRKHRPKSEKDFKDIYVKKLVALSCFKGWIRNSNIASNISNAGLHLKLILLKLYEHFSKLFLKGNK